MQTTKARNLGLCFDTECTGLPNMVGFNKFPCPSITREYDLSRIVQIGWVIVNLDTGDIMDKKSFLCTPVNWNWYMNDQALRIHGITKQHIARYGQPFHRAKGYLFKDLLRCNVVMGHNLEFDINVLKSEIYRDKDITFLNVLNSKKMLCTMKKYTSLVGLLRYNGMPKWPSLSELHTFCFGKGHNNAHSALADAEATAKCYGHIETDTVK